MAYESSTFTRSAPRALPGSPTWTKISRRSASWVRLQETSLTISASFPCQSRPTKAVPPPTPWMACNGQPGLGGNHLARGSWRATSSSLTWQGLTPHRNWLHAPRSVMGTSVPHDSATRVSITEISFSFKPITGLIDTEHTIAYPILGKYRQLTCVC